MLDMSFSEIAVIGAVALVVLGPERLPKVARTAGELFGRLQRYVATVKADINREMESSELAKIKQEVQDAAKSFELSVQQHARSVEKESVAISQSISPQSTSLAGESMTVSAPSAPQGVQQVPHDEDKGRAAATMVEVEKPNARRALEKTGSSIQAGQDAAASLDFGIEPVRAFKSP